MASTKLIRRQPSVGASGSSTSCHSRRCGSQRRTTVGFKPPCQVRDSVRDTRKRFPGFHSGLQIWVRCIKDSPSEGSGEPGLLTVLLRMAALRSFVFVSSSKAPSLCAIHYFGMLADHKHILGLCAVSLAAPGGSSPEGRASGPCEARRRCRVERHAPRSNNISTAHSEHYRCAGVADARSPPPPSWSAGRLRAIGSTVWRLIGGCCRPVHPWDLSDLLP